jgi:hypothetical protein
VPPIYLLSQTSWSRRDYCTDETLSRSARFPGKIFPSSRLKSPQAIPVIAVSVAMFGKQSVDHVGANPLKVIQLLPLPTSKPTASGTQKKQSKQMGYHNGITAGTHLSCAAKSGGWRTKLSRTAVRTMGQARGNNQACAGLPFGRGCGCRPQTRAGKQPTPWCRCLTDWPRICLGLFGMTLGG